MIGVIGVNRVIGVIGVNRVMGVNRVIVVIGMNGAIGVTQLVEDYFVQKALYSNEFLRMMDIRSDQQQQEQLHESLVNWLRM